MDRYEVMAGKMAPLTDGAHRKWGFTGKVENRGFGVAVRKVRCHRGEDGTVRVSSVETMHERRYTVDDWRYDTADCEQTENGQKG